MERINIPRQKLQSQTKDLEIAASIGSSLSLSPTPFVRLDMLSVAMLVTLHLQSLFNLAKEKGNTRVFRLCFCYATPGFCEVKNGQLL